MNYMLHDNNIYNVKDSKYSDKFNYSLLSNNIDNFNLEFSVVEILVLIYDFKRSNNPSKHSIENNFKRK